MWQPHYHTTAKNIALFSLNKIVFLGSDSIIRWKNGLPNWTFLRGGGGGRHCKGTINWNKILDLNSSLRLRFSPHRLRTRNGMEHTHTTAVGYTGPEYSFWVWLMVTWKRRRVPTRTHWKIVKIYGDMAWQPSEAGLSQILQLLKESQSPDTEIQRAVQQVSFYHLGLICREFGVV